MEKQTKEDLIKLGLEGLENISKETVDTLFKAIELIALSSENKIDDVLLPFLPLIKEKLLQIIDKIS